MKRKTIMFDTVQMLLREHSCNSFVLVNLGAQKYSITFKVFDRSRFRSLFCKMPSTIYATQPSALHFLCACVCVCTCVCVCVLLFFCYFVYK